MSASDRMARRPRTFLAVLLLGLGIAAVPAPGTAAPEPAARTASLQLAESYSALRSLDEHRRPVSKPVALSNLSLPFRSVLEGLLRHAGIELLPEPGAAADLHFVIRCEGSTKGQLYDAAVQSRRIRELRYTDARIEGTLQLVAGSTVTELAFSGTVGPVVSIIGIVDGGDHRRDPNYAPFRAAFEAEGGFLDRLAELIRARWGEAPLHSALGDRDPLVRAAAARALE